MMSFLKIQTLLQCQNVSQLRFRGKQAVKKTLSEKYRQNEHKKEIFKMEYDLQNKQQQKALASEAFDYNSQEPSFLVKEDNRDEITLKGLVNNTMAFRSYNFKQLQQIVQSLREGVAQMHAAGVIHGDLNGDNIKISLDRNGVANGTVKFQNFGFQQAQMYWNKRVSESSTEITVKQREEGFPQVDLKETLLWYYVKNVHTSFQSQDKYWSEEQKALYKVQEKYVDVEVKQKKKNPNLPIGQPILTEIRNFTNRVLDEESDYRQLQKLILDMRSTNEFLRRYVSEEYSEELMNTVESDPKKAINRIEDSFNKMQFKLEQSAGSKHPSSRRARVQAKFEKQFGQNLRQLRVH